ncbi:hypothetical protein BH20ACT9_BH20ACT9_05300 [soil metagenome]
MSRVLVTRHMPTGGLAPLDGHELVTRDDDLPLTPGELRAAVADADALVCPLTDRINGDVIDAGRRLRVIGNVAVGVDNVDVEAATGAGVAVCNTPGVLDETTADLTFALVLAAARRMSEAEADLRGGRWSGWGVTQYLGHDVHGATLGLVGYGRIGRRPGGARRSACGCCTTPGGTPASRATSPGWATCWRPRTSSACTCRSPTTPGTWWVPASWRG